MRAWSLRRVRVGWPTLAALTDHGASAAASIFLIIIVARNASVEEFGQFALLQAIYLGFVFAYRHIVGSSLVASVLSAVEERYCKLEAPVILWGLSLPLYIPIMLAIGGTQEWLAITAFAFLALSTYLHTGLRYLAYRHQRSWKAAGISLLMLLPALVLLFPLGEERNWRTDFGIFSGLTLLISASLVATRRALELRPAYRVLKELARRELVHLRALSKLYLGSFVAQVGVPFAISIFAGSAALGAFRGAQTMISVGLQLPQGVQPLILAATARNFRDLGVYIARALHLWIGLLLTSMSVALVVLWFIPDTLGRSFLGEVWAASHELLPLIFAEALFAQLAAGLEGQFRALGHSQNAAGPRLIASGLAVVLGAGGAQLAGAPGAVLALAVVNAALCGWLWQRLRQVVQNSLI